LFIESIITGKHVSECMDRLRCPYQLPLPLHPFLVERQLKDKTTIKVTNAKNSFLFIVFIL